MSLFSVYFSSEIREKYFFFNSIFLLLGFFGKRTSTSLTCLLQLFYRDVFYRIREHLVKESKLLSALAAFSIVVYYSL